MQLTGDVKETRSSKDLTITPQEWRRGHLSGAQQ